VFASVAEVFTAFAHQKLGVHARIRVRLPIDVVSSLGQERW